MSDELFDANEEEEKGRWPYVAIYVIYILAVVFAEVMFIGMMQHIFANFHPFLMAFAAAGAVAAGLTVIVMPWAKKNWMATSEMNTVSWVFWILELLVLSLNTILSFDIANGVGDSWVTWWRHISPASPILAVLAWGVLMQMHPAFKRSQSRLRFIGRVEQKLEKKLLKRLDSQEVNERMDQEVEALIDSFMDRKFAITVTRRPGLPPPTRIINHQPKEAGRKRFSMRSSARGDEEQAVKDTGSDNGTDPTQR